VRRGLDGDRGYSTFDEPVIEGEKWALPIGNTIADWMLVTIARWQVEDAVANSRVPRRWLAGYHNYSVSLNRGLSCKTALSSELWISIWPL